MNNLLHSKVYAPHRQPHKTYADMLQYWEMAEDIREGTPALKDKGDTYLPQEPKELPVNYRNRLSKATFHNITAKTVSALVGLGLSRNVHIGTDAHPILQSMTKDVDLQGTDLQQFTQNILEESIWKGHTFIWADVPDSPYIRTKHQLLNSQVRPYLIHIPPEQVIDWRHTYYKSRPVLTMVKMVEVVEEPTDDGLATVEQYRYRIYNLENQDDPTQETFVSWMLYDYDGGILDQGEMLIDHIPLHPVYSRRTGVFRSRPLLLDMFYLNIRHYQVSSDRAYHLHLCAIPFLKLKGRADTSQDIVISPNTAIDIDGDNGDIGWVELEGSTLEQQLKELESLEVRMYSIGISTFGRQAVERRTATEASQDFVTANSDLHRVLRNTKSALQSAFASAADLLSIEDVGTISLAIDFDFSGADPQQILAMLKLHESMILPTEEILRYLRRRQLTSDEWDIREAPGTYGAPVGATVDKQSDQTGEPNLQ